MPFPLIIASIFACSCWCRCCASASCCCRFNCIMDIRNPEASISAKIPAPISPFLKAAEYPPRNARIAPVAKPEIMGFTGSSFLRAQSRQQSTVENTPPQSAKLPIKCDTPNTSKNRSSASNVTKSASHLFLFRRVPHSFDKVHYCTTCTAQSKSAT